MQGLQGVAGVAEQIVVEMGASRESDYENEAVISSSDFICSLLLEYTEILCCWNAPKLCFSQSV